MAIGIAFFALLLLIILSVAVLKYYVVQALYSGSWIKWIFVWIFIMAIISSIPDEMRLFEEWKERRRDRKETRHREWINGLRKNP